jgi:uncharacterized OsmC-like protein
MVSGWARTARQPSSGPDRNFEAHVLFLRGRMRATDGCADAPDPTLSPGGEILRKYLIAALAAITAIAVASVAIAQSTPTATMTVKVTPKQSGTKAKPKNGKINLKIVNDDPNRTMDNLKISLPSNGKLSLVGLKKCSEDTITNQECPASRALGTGIAEASQGVNTPTPNPLFFKVTPYPMSSRQIGFFLQQLNKDANGKPTSVVIPGGISVVSVGTLGKASKPYGQILDIVVPKLAQEFPTGTFNGLVSLQTTLTKKVGKHYLVNEVGCVKGKFAFAAELHFIPNPDPAHAGTAKTKTTAKCTK